MLEQIYCVKQLQQQQQNWKKCKSFFTIISLSIYFKVSIRATPDQCCCGKWAARLDGTTFNCQSTSFGLFKTCSPETIRICHQVIVPFFAVSDSYILFIYHESWEPRTIKEICLALSARKISPLFPIWEEKSYLKNHLKILSGHTMVQHINLSKYS